MQPSTTGNALKDTLERPSQDTIGFENEFLTQLKRSKPNRKIQTKMIKERQFAMVYLSQSTTTVT